MRKAASKQNPKLEETFSGAKQRKSFLGAETAGSRNTDSLGERKELFCRIIRTSVGFYHPEEEFAEHIGQGFSPLIKVTEFEVLKLSEIISYSSISTKSTQKSSTEHQGSR